MTRGNAALAVVLGGGLAACHNPAPHVRAAVEKER